MYGHQIIKELERTSQGYFKFKDGAPKPKEGTLYTALHRLERSGFLGKRQRLPGGCQRDTIISPIKVTG
jgi:DNA-binding PadR family transcriptional regulator